MRFKSFIGLSLLESFYKGYKISGGYVEVLKNPSKKELMMIPSYKKYREFKAFLDGDDIYAFDGNFIHDHVRNSDSFFEDKLAISVVLEDPTKDKIATVLRSGSKEKFSKEQQIKIKRHKWLNVLFDDINIVV